MKNNKQTEDVIFGKGSLCHIAPKEVAVVCPSCKGTGTEPHMVVPDDLDPTKRARPAATFFRLKCRQCSGYGKVRIPLKALNVLKLEED